MNDDDARQSIRHGGVVTEVPMPPTAGWHSPSSDRTPVRSWHNSYGFYGDRDRVTRLGYPFRFIPV